MSAPALHARRRFLVCIFLHFFGSAHASTDDSDTLLSRVDVAPAGEAEVLAPRGLAVFTLIRGGPSEATYKMFVSSRQCLQNVMPPMIQFDNVVFTEEGTVPPDMQQMLLRRV